MTAHRRMIPGLAAAGLLILACAELPTAETGKTRLELSFTGPAFLFIGDTAIFEVEARDPAGNLLAAPPLQWRFRHDLSADPFLTIDTAGGSRWLVGSDPGSVRVEVMVGAADPHFTSDSIAAELQIGYGAFTVMFTDVGSDTLLAAQGPFQVDVAAVDYRGRPVRHGFFQLSTSHPVSGWVTSSNTLWLEALAAGEATLVLSHTLCAEPCGDTLRVRVEPVPAYITFPVEFFRAISLGETIPLSATVYDANGYAIPFAPLEWQLVSPADTVIAIEDPAAGAAVALTNGWSRVRATHADISAEIDVLVRQEVYRFQLEGVPPHVVGIGTTATARFDAWDALANPFTAEFEIAPQWWSTDSSRVTISEQSATEAIVATRDYGQVFIAVEVWTCVANGFCNWDAQSLPLRVIPEPDSVRIVTESADTMYGLGTTIAFLGDIYLPDEHIAGVPLFWLSLDPAIATIDDAGTVTAVAEGTAQIVGNMGAAADTATVYVVECPC